MSDRELKPKCLPGALVNVRAHSGRAVMARVATVETRWASDGTCTHIYATRQPGHKRLQWMGDLEILEVLT